jgi:hypothetical protein
VKTRAPRALPALLVATVLVALPVALDACETVCRVSHATMTASSSPCHHSSSSSNIGHMTHACTQDHGGLMPRIHDVRELLGAALVDLEPAVAQPGTVALQRSIQPLPPSPSGSAIGPNSPLRI